MNTASIATRQRILLVDDSQQLLDAVSFVLRRRGYAVVTARTVPEAMARLEDGPPIALVIADLDLGSEETGFDLVRKADAWSGGSLPIIVLSGLCSEKDFTHAYGAGARDYLKKPVSPQELLAKCAKHLRAPEELAEQAAFDGVPTGVIRDRFRIGRRLGQGAYGTVYSARDLVVGRPVALKFLVTGPRGDRESLARFMREMSALGQVRSPYVIDIIYVGSHDGEPFFAMEWVAGETLEDKVLAGHRATRDEAIGLLRGLARALAALEDANLVHRDVKPANVMLRGGRFEDPVLIDFGLAKHPSDRSVTQSGYIVGTPGYIAPEVVRGLPVDHRSDLFGLGAVARFALCGDDPFPALGGYRLLEAMAQRAVEIPTTVDRDLRALLLGLVQPKPDERLQSAQDLLDCLSILRLHEAALDETPAEGEPIDCRSARSAPR